MKKLWGGAFEGQSSDLVDRFGQSIESDLRFWREDVEGSIAHAEMLGETGILSDHEAQTIVSGLHTILDEGPASLRTDVEDIHTAVEQRLSEIVGPVAGKLHTARSRNDQVATDARLYLRRRIDDILREVKALQAILLDQARLHKGWVMPGYTHQQPAQPVTLGFHHLAHFWALQRTGCRLEHVRTVANLCPLGSAALAGTGFPIDRLRTSRALGFAAPIPNALDATSDRSFVLDALHACAAAMIDLSRMAQELILWSGAEYGFLRLSDSVTTGSSIMPQKRNPDMAELIRGRTGRAIGNWTAFAATMKALPLGYNRDAQDDKPAMFDSLDLVEDSMRLMGEMVAGAQWNRQRLEEAAAAGFSTATDLADHLASHGMPFREAHEVVGGLVREAVATQRSLQDVASARLAEISPALAKGIRPLLDPKGSVKARESLGGPGQKALSAQLRRARTLHRAAGFGRLA